MACDTRENAQNIPRQTWPPCTDHTRTGMGTIPYTDHTKTGMGTILYTDHTKTDMGTIPYTDHTKTDMGTHFSSRLNIRRLSLILAIRG